MVYKLFCYTHTNMKNGNDFNSQDWPFQIALSCYVSGMKNLTGIYFVIRLFVINTDSIYIY